MLNFLSLNADIEYLSSHFSSQYVRSDKFGRMFPTPKKEDILTIAELKAEIEALDELGKVMVQTSEYLEDNEAIPAGYSYLGQFIAHDISFDASVLGENIVEPLTITNYRTPQLDLDCLYGGGPQISPYLYQRYDKAKFQLGKVKVNTFNFNEKLLEPENESLLRHDVPRSPEGFALTADPRNDDNVIVSQLHLALLKFHNKIVEQIRNNSEKLKATNIIAENDNRAARTRKIFEIAKRIVVHHYQSIVMYDFLPKITHFTQPEIKNLLTKENQLFSWIVQKPFIPVEFSAAAFRLGHSMIRPHYKLNSLVRTALLSDLLLFTGSFIKRTALPASWIVNWKNFFQIDDNVTPNFSQKINTKLTNPFSNVAGERKALSVRNLQRGRYLNLPSGQSVAKFMGIKPLTPEQILTTDNHREREILKKYNFHYETPLWYYVLKEAELQGGRCLGEIGSYIVVTVFLNLLQTDNNSFIFGDKNWKPILDRKNEDYFTMVDLLIYVDDIIDPVTTLLNFQP